jgi:hypothetical protein
MTKRLHVIIVVVGLMMGIVPLSIHASEMDFIVMEQTESQISVSVNGQIVYVNGAQGEILEVVSLTGRQIMSVKIENSAQRVELNVPKGCYILKVGKVVRKIQLR